MRNFLVLGGGKTKPNKANSGVPPAKYKGDKSKEGKKHKRQKTVDRRQWRKIYRFN
jgi:hypothetical protein